MIEDGLAAFASSFHYCEPVGFGIIKQPINVLGNIGFLAAFFYSWHKIGLRHLTLASLLIFIGSTIWHSGLHPVGLVLDIVPIMLWVIFFLWAMMKHHFNIATRYFAIGIFIFFLVLVNKMTENIFPMNSGLFVALAFTLFTIGYGLYNYNRQFSYLFIYACFLLNIAIIARMADIPFCDKFSSGTHWIWHLFAGFALFPLIKIIYIFDNIYVDKNTNKIYI